MVFDEPILKGDILESLAPGPEGFDFRKQEGFSHPLCVQKAYYMVIDCLGIEMVEGFWEEKTDRFGNKLMIYHKDTRREAIESIETLKNILIGDLSEKDGLKFKDKIKEYKKQIEILEKEYIQKQIEWLKNLSFPLRKDWMEKNKEVDLNFLYNKLQYCHLFLNKKVEIYRKIFEQLELCMKENRYFGKQKNIAGAN